MPHTIADDRYYLLANDGSEILMDVLFLTPHQNPDFLLTVGDQVIKNNGTVSVENLSLGVDELMADLPICLTGCVVNTSPDANEVKIGLVLKGGKKVLTKEYIEKDVARGATVNLFIIIRPIV